MKTARQVKSLYLSGHISFRAAHTALRAIGYTDIEADDILYDADSVWRRGENPTAKSSG
ncbi:MAG: hypothetical protein ABWY82_00720 [Tardiphaga sp.]